MIDVIITKNLLFVVFNAHAHYCVECACALNNNVENCSMLNFSECKTVGGPMGFSEELDPYECYFVFSSY